MHCHADIAADPRLDPCLESCRGHSDLPPKNRVGGSRLPSRECVWNFAPQLPESHQEFFATPTITASGICYYPTADPIGQIGGWNLYQSAENNPLSEIDPWGLEPRSTWGGDDPGFDDPEKKIRELEEELKNPCLGQREKEKIRRRIKELRRRPSKKQQHHFSPASEAALYLVVYFTQRGLEDVLEYRENLHSIFQELPKISPGFPNYPTVPVVPGAPGYLLPPPILFVP